MLGIVLLLSCLWKVSSSGNNTTIFAPQTNISLDSLVSTLDSSLDDSTIVMGSCNHDVIIYKLSSDGYINSQNLTQSQSHIHHVDITDDGKFILSLSLDGNAYVYTQQNSQENYILFSNISLEDSSSILTGAIADDHSYIIIGKYSGFTYLLTLNLETNEYELNQTIFVSNISIFSISLAPDRSFLAVGLNSKQAYIYKYEQKMGNFSFMQTIQFNSSSDEENSTQALRVFVTKKYLLISSLYQETFMLIFNNETQTFELNEFEGQNITGSMSPSIADNNEWIFITSLNRIVVYQYCKDYEDLHYESIESKNESQIFLNHKIGKSFQYLYVVLKSELRIYPIDIEEVNKLRCLDSKIKQIENHNQHQPSTFSLVILGLAILTFIIFAIYVKYKNQYDPQWTQLQH